MKASIAYASILALSVSAFPFSELFKRRESQDGITGRDNIQYNRDCNATGYGESYQPYTFSLAYYLGITNHKVALRLTQS